MNVNHKRLAFLITGLGYGGAETQLLRLAAAMKARAWSVHVITMLAPHAFARHFEDVGIPVSSLHMRRGVPDPRAPFRLGRLLRRLHPDVVHSHMVHANLLARISRPLHRVSVIVSTVHSTHEGSRWRERAIRMTDPLCDLTTGVSQATVDRYIRKRLAPEHKIRLIHNGVDTSRFRPIPAKRDGLRRDLALEGYFIWLAVGRFTIAKDYPTLFRAFIRLIRAKPRSLLLIAGDGPLRNELDELVKQLGLESNVRFLGVRRDIPELMNAADAYVISSTWEGLGMVLQEASAIGLPIVATDVGGIPEVVVDGRTGYLVPPREPAALAAVMQKLMEMPEAERREMGAQGRANVHENFAMERVVDTWERLYDDLLRGTLRDRPGGWAV